MGIIIQHLCGNIRQWIISGVGDKEDTRDRPREFMDTAKSDKDSLLHALSQVVTEAKDTLRKTNDNILCEKRTIQKTEITVLSAIYQSVSHFELHTGQILYASRIALDDQYKLSWFPPGEKKE